ncbi:MAG: GspH/FimT family pseudopilin [Gammaproteobacteria bacterium]|jgi:type IV fimbrial biogenesis protein FimT|nr:GspH/FimT family pseudopilin [Gammaproteobacteria bacterium]
MGMGRERGFTLIELAIVVAVAGILLVVGVPALQDMVRNNRLVTETNNLVAHLNLARSEAVKRRVRVAVCSSADSEAAVPACDGGTDWDTGWVVFVDANSNGSVDDAANVLRRGGAVTGATDVRTSAGALSFAADGSVPGGNAFTFAVCDDRGIARGRQIAVAGIGRPQLSGPPIADCTP